MLPRQLLLNNLPICSKQPPSRLKDDCIATMSAFHIEYTNKIDFCPFCQQMSKGESAKSCINRHIKTQALKQTKNPDENNPHPAEHDERFKAIAAQCNLYSRVKDEDERIVRRAETQRKNLLKRAAKNTPKVEAAFESLRYLPVFPFC